MVTAETESPDLARSYRILVVVYDYPPSTSVGGTRWLTMKKYLERVGHEVTVLTTDAYGALPSDRVERVVRVPDLVASSRLRRLLSRPALPTPGQKVEVDKAPPRLLTGVAVPDIYAISWVPRAAVALRRLHQRTRFDAVVSTSPKDSTHLVGLTIPRGGPAWVADFRDGWIFESTRPPLPTAPQRTLDRALERLVVRRADAVVAFSKLLQSDFGDRLGRAADYVPNGWDPDLGLPDHGSSGAFARDAESQRKVRLVYTGTLTGAVGAATDRTPLALLEALEALAIQQRDLGDRVELLIAGRVTERDERLLERFAKLGVITHVGYVSRSESLELQRTADILVLVSGTTPSSIPHKLFEYLGAQRPILHLGHPGSAADLLDETGAGVTVAHDDPVGIVAAIQQILHSRLEVSRDEPAIARYTYPPVADEMASVIERAIAARTARSRRRR